MPEKPRVVRASEVRELRELERQGDYEALIDGLRERIAADRRTLTSSWVKRWCGRRWRDLFLAEAVGDERAVKAASARLDPAARGGPWVRIGRDGRPARRRIAERFLAHDIDDWRLELPPFRPRKARTTLILCPGFFHTAMPIKALVPELGELERSFGLRVLRAPAHAFRGCEANVADLLDAVERGRGSDAAGEPLGRPRRPRDVVLLGYSKGSPDALALLAKRPDLAPKVRSLVCWAGCIGGSPSADGVYGTIEDASIDLGPASGPLATLIKALLPVARLEHLGERADEWDFKAAVRDLTTTERRRFLRRHARAIDALDVPIFNLVAACSPLEVPFFQLQGAVEIGRAVGENDMQVAVRDAQMKTPMATTLAVCRAHHWDLALGPFPRRLRLGSPNLDNPFPREAALAATIALQLELGLLD